MDILEGEIVYDSEYLIDWEIIETYPNGEKLSRGTRRNWYREQDYDASYASYVEYGTEPPRHPNCDCTPFDEELLELSIIEKPKGGDNK